MAAFRPSYAPNSPLDCLPPTERLLLRVRRRTRRRWSVQKLLDEREEMLAALGALERGRARVVAKLNQRATEKPAARGVIEEASQQVRRKARAGRGGWAISTAGQRQHPECSGRQTVGEPAGLDFRCPCRR